MSTDEALRREAKRLVILRSGAQRRDEGPRGTWSACGRRPPGATGSFASA